MELTGRARPDLSLTAFPDFREYSSLLRPNMDAGKRDELRQAAYDLLGTPRSHLRVRLRHAPGSVTVEQADQVLTGVELDASGVNAASAIALALGVQVPPEGEVNEVLVSTGLLYRVLALSDLDFTNPVSFELANELVDEAIRMQRSSGALSEA